MLFDGDFKLKKDILNHYVGACKLYNIKQNEIIQKIVSIKDIADIRREFLHALQGRRDIWIAIDRLFPQSK
jgi:hypothetical protein